MTPADVKSLFADEFGSIKDKFEVYDLPLAEVADSQAEHVWKPGVYVFWTPSHNVIRVGRALDNARKRALMHLPADTGREMAALVDDADARLLLFNVKDERDRHWVAAIEVFFEQHLSPKIKSPLG